jgi:hypothetical protein
VATIPLTDPKLHNVLRSCGQALRRLADYQLDPSLELRLQELGERKEFLNAGEHAELMALVAFSQKRTLEKLEARVALERLREFFPGVVDAASAPFLKNFGRP